MVCINFTFQSQGFCSNSKCLISTIYFTGKPAFHVFNKVVLSIVLTSFNTSESTQYHSDFLGCAATQMTDGVHKFFPCDVNVIHQRLGHVSFSVLQRTLTACNTLKLSNKELNFC